MPRRVSGIDLAASPKGVTGVAILALSRGEARLEECFEDRLDDEGLVEMLLGYGVHASAIDAPLGVAGRGFRRVEREAMRLGARLLPHGIPGVRRLAGRGIRLASLLSAFLEVFETHPYSVVRVSGCRQAGRMLALLKLEAPRCGRHAVDALLAAVPLLLLARGEAVILAGERYGFILPRPGLCKSTLTPV